MARSAARSQAMARSWLNAEPYRRLSRTFAQSASGDLRQTVEMARQLLTDADWIEPLLAPLIAALADDAAFEPPLRIHRDPLRIGAVLYEDERVTITASVVSADALAAAPAPASVVVPGRISVIRYHRTGGAMLNRWIAGPPADPFVAALAAPCVPTEPLPLREGEVRVLDGRIEGSMITSARCDLVTVTAQLRFGAVPMMREYALDTHRLIRSATLDDAGSRTRMLLTLLRLSGRADAGACFEAATRDAGFDLRWAAMREWLALDTGAALPRLRAMAAGDDHAEVREAACATIPVAEALLCRA